MEAAPAHEGQFNYQYFLSDREKTDVHLRFKEFVLYQFQQSTKNRQNNRFILSFILR